MPEGSGHWFVDSEGPDTPAFRTAFSWFLDRIAASPGGQQGLLVVHGKGNLDGGAIEAVLGPAAVRALKKDNGVRLRRSAIRLMTEKIMVYAWSGPMLVVYPSPKLLDVVDGLQAPSDVLVVPWVREEVEPWIRMWGARELGSSAKPEPKRFSNPTVRAALESLTSHVNLSTGLAHPSDRAAAITMFRLLQDAGEPFDPDEARDWLISELGWQPQHANKVSDVAEGVLEGRRFRTSGSGDWAPDILEVWRERGRRA